jgi:hypothetical protein
MEKLVRNNDNIVKIEVNDEGEIITLNLADRDFPKRFYTLYENLTKRIEEYEKQRNAKEEMSIAEEIDADLEMHKAMMVDIDNLLGTGTCRKVFGNIVPDVDAVTDFFEQIIPIIQKYGNKRRKKISDKYSPARMGEAR